MSRTALVTGGTGAVGRHVLSQLALRRDIATTFTFHTRSEAAAELAASTGATALKLDLRDQDAVRQTIASLHPAPTTFIHCAAVMHASPLSSLQSDPWHEELAVNTTAPLIIVQTLLEPMIAAGGGDIVVVGALDRGQSLPIPVGFAATQGALSALVMAMSRELGDHRIRVNMVSSGLLESGLSSALPDSTFEDYKTFSAMRRLGKPEEVARAVVWLALENSYMSGKILPVNGGI